MLSTKPPITVLSPSLTHPSMRGALKKRKRTGDIGDPYRIPIWTGFISLIFWLRVSAVSLPDRKLSTQPTIHAGIPFILRLCRRRGWDTLGNAPATSRDSREATFCLPHPKTVWILPILSISNMKYIDEVHALRSMSVYVRRQDELRALCKYRHLSRHVQRFSSPLLRTMPLLAFLLLDRPKKRVYRVFASKGSISRALTSLLTSTCQSELCPRWAFDNSRHSSKPPMALFQFTSLSACLLLCLQHFHRFNSINISSAGHSHTLHLIKLHTLIARKPFPKPSSFITNSCGNQYISDKLNS